MCVEHCTRMLSLSSVAIPPPPPTHPHTHAQVNGNSMVDVTHDDAVNVLKATQETVVLTIEKNAISDIPGSDEVSD